jgi:hypothetical protein
MVGSGEYDPAFYERLTTCFAKDDDTDLRPAQEGAWSGMGNYYNSNGTDSDYMGKTDYWGMCSYDSDPRCR